MPKRQEQQQPPSEEDHQQTERSPQPFEDMNGKHVPSSDPHHSIYETTQMKQHYSKFHPNAAQFHRPQAFPRQGGGPYQPPGHRPMQHGYFHRGPRYHNGGAAAVPARRPPPFPMIPPRHASAGYQQYSEGSHRQRSLDPRRSPIHHLDVMPSPIEIAGKTASCTCKKSRYVPTVFRCSFMKKCEFHLS